ncbi:hypothetical protein B0T14DRAFT_440796 [Immersiella caudata]|uniref:Uncharacterized protein n=1 Tax=Immersiella caudata TaxID=314043 RepID=A0AA39TTR2_9PEZI|nr:hypothetical protein B0T14DRAFT_440796 [Immersiella caudata]
MSQYVAAQISQNPRRASQLGSGSQPPRPPLSGLSLSEGRVDPAELENEPEYKCRWCKKPGSFFRAPVLSRCAGCRPTDLYHTSCTVTGCLQINCTKEGHPVCWAQHRERDPPHLQDEHQEINPIFQLFVDTVMSEKDQARFNAAQSRERFARWFSVTRTRSLSTGREEAHLWLYDRFTRLCDPHRSGNQDTLDHFPTFVSFIGSTSAGKSTILRAILLLGLLDSANRSDTEAVVRLVNQARDGRVEMPVPRSGDFNDITNPTTFGVHLYRDEGISHSRTVPSRRTSGFRGRPHAPRYPLLLADCEGFEAGEARPSASRLPELGDDDDAGLRKLPITAECYSQKGQGGVDLFYARVLYAISDVIVYVTKGDNIMHNLQKILEWAASAVDKSYNQPTRKTLIIVRNMERELVGESVSEADFENLYLYRNREVLWKGSEILTTFVAKHNRHVRPEDRIEDNEKLYGALFHKIRCCYIPDRGEAGTMSPERAELVFKHFETLRGVIEDASAEEQMLRARNFAEHNVPTMTHILSEVFDHFRQSEDPLDLFLATRGDNPTPQNMSEHIANFLRMTLGHPQHEGEDIDEAIIQTVALSFLVGVRRGLNVLYPGDMFDRELKRYWADAVEMYLQKYDRCLHRWFPGSTAVEEVACTIRGRSQHKLVHIGPSAKQTQPGGFSGRSWSEPEKEGWIRRIRDRFVAMCHEVFPAVQHKQEPPDGLLLSLRRSVHGQVRNTLCRMQSNKTCFACLQAPPDHVLPCGHAFCPRCVQETANASRFVESAFDVPSCLLCGRHTMHQIRLKPRCAGVRILTLDGGGVRGVVELALLTRIHKAVGLDINIRDMFDLVMGTSTGGIIALGLVMKSDTLEAMSEFFDDAAKETFGKPNATTTIIAKALMVLGTIPSLYPATNLRQKLEAYFGSNTPLFAPATSGSSQSSTTRVAVTTAKDGPDGGSTHSLIANYNRPQGDWSHFEREDDAAKDMKIWEAGLATSAAPIFLPVFRKGTTNYVDGALYANCPARLALEERDRIWERGGASLDLLVSLGTGAQDREWKLPGILRYRFFSPLLKAFERQMNSAKTWDNTIEHEAVSSPVEGQRLCRLNPRIHNRRGGEVDLDDHGEMRFLRASIEEGALSPQEADTIQRVAHSLLASLLFFEPNHDKQNENSLLRGSIRCRLPHESQATATLLKDKIETIHLATVTREEATAMSRIPPGRWEVLSSQGTTRPSDMMVYDDDYLPGENSNDASALGIRMFRLGLTLRTNREDRPYCVVAVKLKGSAGTSELVPISGFPATIQELKDRCRKLCV